MSLQKISLNKLIRTEQKSADVLQNFSTVDDLVLSTNYLKLPKYLIVKAFNLLLSFTSIYYTNTVSNVL
jgi:hypothetical protein